MKWLQIPITGRLQQCSRTSLFLGFSGLLLIIGMIDYCIRWNLGLSIFYVLPIAALTWYIHPQLGYAASCLSASLWMIAEKQRLPTSENGLFLIWNACVRLAFFLLIVTLLMELQEAFHREQILASTDSLTQLLNRRAFLEILAREIQRSHRHTLTFTLVYLDVDNFKNINDTLGHAAGDRFLQSMAQVFTQNLRQVDYQARLGGDEFALLLPQTDQQQATSVLTRVFDQLSAIDIAVAAVGISMGAVTFKTTPESADQALVIADRLMYTVKASGKHQFVQQEWSAID